MIEQQAGQRILMPDGMSARVIMPRGAAAVPGWWLAAGVNPLAAYQAKGAANYAASLVNLFTPGTYDLTENNGAVTWDAVNGWQFVAAQNKSFNTGITPVNNQAWSMFIQYSSVVLVGNFDVLAGFAIANPQFNIVPNRTANSVIYASGSTRVVLPQLTVGNLGIAGTQGYRNGIADGAAIPAAAGVLGNIFIGGANVAGLVSRPITANIKAVIIYNVTLNAAQAALIVAAMAAL